MSFNQLDQSHLPPLERCVEKEQITMRISDSGRSNCGTRWAGSFLVPEALFKSSWWSHAKKSSSGTLQDCWLDIRRQHHIAVSWQHKFGSTQLSTRILEHMGRIMSPFPRRCALRGSQFFIKRCPPLSYWRCLALWVSPFIRLPLLVNCLGSTAVWFHLGPAGEPPACRIIKGESISNIFTRCGGSTPLLVGIKFPPLASPKVI